MHELRIPDEANRLLHTWAAWQARSVSFARGYPTASSGFQSGGCGSPDALEHLSESSDANLAKAVEAILDRMSPEDRAAICQQYLGTVQRYPGNATLQVQAATEHFLTIATEKGITL